MRWLFADPHDPDEAAYVNETIAAIDHWWEEFQAKLEKIENAFKPKSRYNLPKLMEETLQAIHPGLMWEYGPAVKQKDGYRLVITPESQRYLRPMVRTILERAPKLPNWEFYGYRVPESAELTIDTVKGRANVDVSDAVVAASPAPGRKVDLYFDFPGQEDLEEDQARQAAFIATETLLGEQFLDNWIGEIGLVSDNPEAGPTLPLAKAQVMIAQLVKVMFERLPSKRLQDISVEEGWASVSLDPPEKMEDYPGRTDLVSAMVHDIELFQAMHSGQPFASTCHSRVSEQFCYLKLDAGGNGQVDVAAFRGRFERPLNEELVAANAGGVIGGGSGLRYAYIDVGLTDLKRAVGIIRKVLSEHEVPERSWLLFHDDDLGAEWIGLHPHSPPPPEAPMVEE
ncbi:MAG TPA: hypothetical protein VGI40_24560 [Pirellulaceae bacterium]|jgi:hypothetical protein